LGHTIQSALIIQLDKGNALISIVDLQTPCDCGVEGNLTLRLLMSHTYIYIYIYIYDIRSLKVNDLTLILLTWRK
jgi:hypothetical protein